MWTTTQHARGEIQGISFIFLSPLSSLIFADQESPVSQLQVTFAALQAGNQKVFNPTKLVESLQLRTSEQQDAQEYEWDIFLLMQTNYT